jgi:large subunit ribosomal protein L6
MSRVGKSPIAIPAGVEVKIAGQDVTVKGSNGELSFSFNSAVEFVQEGSEIRTLPRDGFENAQAQTGTARSVLNNMVVGVSKGFERKLQLVGVGYRAAAKGDTLNLTLGFSHPVDFPVPNGISIETPSQTEILVKGADKQLVGQVAAKIRGYRPPEPYKGKGVRYADETVLRKEAKKK